jgi:hypothetical protein
MPSPTAIATDVPDENMAEPDANPVPASTKPIAAVVKEIAWAGVGISRCATLGPFGGLGARATLVIVTVAVSAEYSDLIVITRPRMVIVVSPLL